MQKNWYIIYTKAKCEKKVAATLTRKKVKNFLPVNSREVNIFRKRKIYREPLFRSYIFTFISEAEINAVKLIDGVLNVVYWKGKPAVIPEDEIEVIKEFVSDYQNIKLEKAGVNLNEVVRVVDRPKYFLDGNLLTVKNTTVKVNLPSIGFTMVAQVTPASAMEKEVSFGNKELFLQS